MSSTLPGGDILSVFEAVEQNMTTRQAAELYDTPAGRSDMAICPFHNDKNPSVKLNRRFHCFGRQVDGGAVDFVSRLFQVPGEEAAIKLTDDLGIAYNSRQKPTVKSHTRGPTPRQRYRQGEMYYYMVLCEYSHLLQKQEQQYTPQMPEDDLHSLFMEVLRRETYTEYLLDSSLGRPSKEHREPVTRQGKEVMDPEQRITEWTADGILHHGIGQKQPGADRERQGTQCHSQL